MRAVKIIFAIVCFGLGFAFAIGTAEEIIASQNPYHYGGFPAPLLGMFAAMFLLGSFLLLRSKA